MSFTNFRAPMLSLGVFVALGACAAPSASPTPSTSAAPGPSVTQGPSAPASVRPSPPASVPPSLELAWERLELPDLADEGSLLDVVAGGPGFVALGLEFPMGTAILTSGDGREWKRLAVPGLERVGLSSLVESDGLLVAVGRDTFDVDVQQAVVWVSEDGVDWRQASAGPSLADAQLIDVVATDDGFVAIGGYPLADAAGVWTSADGETWEAVPAIEEFEHAFMWSIVEGDDGLVASGWRRNPDPEIGFDPAFWTSADGVEWSLAPIPEGAPGAQVFDVEAFDGGYVGVGDLLAGGRGFAWTSADGVEWQLADTEPFDGATVEEVTQVAGGLLALGGHNVDDGGVWFSNDGEAWTLIDAPAMVDADLSAAILVDEGVLLVGASQERIAESGSYIYTPTIWYGTAR